MRKFSIIIFTILLLIISFLLYARFIGTRNIIIKEFKIINKNITNEYHGLKIAHITDIHYGRTTNEKTLKELVDKVNKTKPDIVVLTGDLIDKDTILTNDMIKIIYSNLKKINASIKKYAISGNHDYKFNEWETIITKGDFINLNDDFDLIYKDSNKPILFAGSSTNNMGSTKITKKLFKTFEYIKENKNIYNILLIHEPDYINKIDKNKFDLILAGHSHNGQVRFPFIGPIILPVGAKKYYNEYYKLNETELYISGGIGTSTVNFRLFNKPSFNLYRLVNK
ncbi:MAG TPA: metallophosphoesterase [Tenericutes bacterium]|nr:metallophosphoesterase [Mycoplasmatota bacterium]